MPQEEVYIETRDYREVAAAIKELRVRGAPAIGVAGAYAIALGALQIRARSTDMFRADLATVIGTITGTRPTARNLFWAAERMERIASAPVGTTQIKKMLVAEAAAIHHEEVERTRKLCEIGSALVGDGATVLTHCNTGPLATAGYGTALGIIIEAARQGKTVRVLVGETRPLLQGSRLTAWELQKAGIPFTLITDSMAGYHMGRGRIDSVIVGADSIAANGDVANKIGTYTLAVLARAHGVPFYVAAPTSTVDTSVSAGQAIIIEERRPDEVSHFAGTPVAPAGTRVANPAFDITPARYITAIITERGVVRKPFAQKLARLHC